jgi:hypothetical protein
MAGTGTNIPARCRVFWGSRSKTNLSRYEVRDPFQVDPALAQDISALVQVRKSLLDQMNLNYQRFVPYSDSLRKQNRDLAIQGTEFQAAVAELTQIRENMERGLGILMDNLNPLLEEKFRPQPKTQEPDRKAA